MPRINDHHANTSSDYGNNGSSPLVRIEKSASSNFNLPVSHSSPVIINVSDSSKLERFSSSSLDRENILDESSFDTIIFDGDARSGCVISSMLVPIATIVDSTFPVLTSPEVEVTVLRREEARTFIKTYHSMFGRDPSDAKIKDHLVRGTSLLVSIGLGHPISFGMMRYLKDTSILWGRMMQANIFGWTLNIEHHICFI